MNLELRLVPLAAGLVDPKSGLKLQALRKSQEKFTSKLKSITSPDIAVLDREIAKGITLRELILDLKPQDTTRSDRLFKGVDTHYANYDLTTFTCLQKDGDEALAIINSILPRLLGKAETQAMKLILPTCFSADAQFAAQNTQVNDETGELQTQEDQIIAMIMGMDLWSDEESVSSKKSVTFKSAKSSAKVTVALDAVSSFGSKTFQRLIKETRNEDDAQTMSDASAASEATTVTSNKSKADSRTSSLTKDTFQATVEKGMQNGIENGHKKVFEQMELNRHKVAATCRTLRGGEEKGLGAA